MDNTTRVKHTLKAMSVITLKSDKIGTIECPCCSGKVNYTKANRNNHIWAKCETENCIEFNQ